MALYLLKRWASSEPRICDQPVFMIRLDLVGTNPKAFRLLLPNWFLVYEFYPHESESPRKLVFTAPRR